MIQKLKFLLFVAWFFSPCTLCGQSVIDAITQWTEVAHDERKPFAEIEFANKPITKIESDRITRILWDDYSQTLRREREQEWQDKVIQIGDLKMKFEYRVFGKAPAEGRRLYISMHGGGGTRPEVNESQWRNQIRLYKPKEGVYLAPRAPNDAWNMWHQGHIDLFFRRIIQDAVLFADVDPNRVYLMGYSAGGDGVYQLAPRMADSLAAAAMMAGHPNNASPLGLRNIGFALHMGEKDAAYNRNRIAKEWKEKLENLKRDDPDGYPHQVVIHEGLGHWMNRKDAVAVDWMSTFVRNVNVEKIVWHPTHANRDDYYWFSTPSNSTKPNDTLILSRKGQDFSIQYAGQSSEIELLLNDQLANLDQPITVKKGQTVIYRKKAERKPIHIYESIQRFGDVERIYCAKLSAPLSTDSE